MTKPALDGLLSLENKVVFVTGAGRGIGAGVALRFAQAGADLVLHYHKSKAGAEKTAADVRALGGKAVLLGADLTRQEEVEGLLSEIQSTFNRLDVLINNAGIYPVNALLETSLQDWQNVLDANLNSAFLCARMAAEFMIKVGQGGSIVNISSIEAQNPTPGHAHYCAAKAALDMFSRTAANELGRHGIRVNSVSPGLIWAEGLEESWPEGVQRWLKAVPLERLGQSDDVADACLFFASEAARWITGANLVVDGGMLTNQVY